MEGPLCETPRRFTLCACFAIEGSAFRVSSHVENLQRILFLKHKAAALNKGSDESKALVQAEKHFKAVSNVCVSMLFGMS